MIVDRERPKYIKCRSDVTCYRSAAAMHSAGTDIFAVYRGIIMREKYYISPLVVVGQKLRVKIATIHARFGLLQRIHAFITIPHLSLD